MKFQSTNASQDLNFTIIDKTYHVPAGGEVDIDPAHVPYVVSRGIMLEPAKPKPKAQPKAEPKPEPKAESKSETK